ncbi:MAG TPA: hypothetical protein VLA04_00055 [Verrucomicrobiae bacterium]|nr:hypothetical protein [Verrucomicrobiae bacterium]
MTVEQFYKETPQPVRGFVELTDGELDMSTSVLYLKGTELCLYIPLKPRGAPVEKAKVLVVNDNKVDVAFYTEMRRKANKPDLAEWTAKNQDKLLRPVASLKGRLAKPYNKVKDAVEAAKQPITADFITLDPNGAADMRLTFWAAHILLGAGITASVFFMAYVVIGPKTDLLGVQWRKDKRGIIGSAGLTDEEFFSSLHNGTGRVVDYSYTLSAIAVSMGLHSGLHYRRSYLAGVLQSLPYSFVSLFFGWWGFPWGPLFTISALGINLTGGNNKTKEFLDDVATLARGETIKRPRRSFFPW